MELDNKFKIFNSEDLISKISSLNLLFRNQNKNIILNRIISLLIKDLNFGNKKIPLKHLHELLRELETNIGEDYDFEPLFPFYQSIGFFGEKHVFSGLNNNLNYSLDIVCKCMNFEGPIKLPEEFKKQSTILINFLLTISECIYQNIENKIGDISKHDKNQKNISCPKNIEEYSRLLIFNESFISGKIDIELFKEMLVLNPIYDDFNEEYLGFTKPFIQINNDYILIDPCSISLGILFAVEKLSENYNCHEDFLNAYNDLSWERIKQRFSFYLMYPQMKNIASKKEIDNLKGLNINETIIPFNDQKAIRLIGIFENSLINETKIEEIFKEQNNHLEKFNYSDNDVSTIVVNFNYLRLIDAPAYFIKNANNIFLYSFHLEDVLTNEKENINLFFALVNVKQKYLSSKCFYDDYQIISNVYFSPTKGYYFSDDCMAKDVNLNLCFKSLYMYSVIAAKQKLYYDTFFNKQPIELVRVKRNFYLENPMFHKGNISCSCIKLGAHNIWFAYDLHDLHAQYASNVLIYWISEFEDEISSCLKQDTYVQVKSNSNVKNYTYQKICEISYYLDINPSYLDQFINNEDENKGEKELFTSLIYLIESSQLIKIFPKIINEFNNKNQKFEYSEFSFGDYQLQKEGSNKSVQFDPIQYNIVLDEIGEYCFEELNVKPGIILDAQKYLYLIVEFLFKKFETVAANFDFERSIMYLYKKSILFTNKALTKKNFGSKTIQLFPEEEKDFYKQYRSDNQMSTGFKFITEYFLSVRPNGAKILNDIDIHLLFSYLFAINEFARLCDAIKGKAIENTMMMCESHRIAFKIDELNMIYGKINNALYKDIKNPTITGKIEYYIDINTDINKSFYDLYKYTVADLAEAYGIFMSYMNDAKAIMHSKPLDIYKQTSLIKKHNITADLFIKIINDFSIHKRDKYLDEKFNNKDLLPWKSNRLESLNIKPFILIRDEIYWNNYFLMVSYSHLIGMIQYGYFSNRNSGFKKIASRVGNKKGDSFNLYVKEELEKRFLFPNYIVRNNLKAVNQVKIKDENRCDLGDIDVLLINKIRKEIILIETKNFVLSLDIVDVLNEKKKMFDDENSLLKKQLRRFEWAKRHIDDFIKMFKLEGNNWRVKYTFVTSNPLISKNLVEQPINHVVFKDITDDYFDKLK